MDEDRRTPRVRPEKPGQGRIVSGRRYRKVFFGGVRRTVVLVEWLASIRAIFVRTQSSSHHRPILKGVHLRRSVIVRPLYFQDGRVRGVALEIGGF